MKLNVCLFFVSAIALASCVDIPDLSVVPRIDYNGINQRTETDTVSGKAQKTEVVTLTVDFEDGDGDLGLSDEDRQDSIKTAVYATVPGWGIPANYELVTMVMNDDSTWSEYILSEDRFKFFKVLKPDGKTGPIKGKLDLNIRFLYLGSAELRKVKFKVRIMDRAFHISNQVGPSDEVIAPVYVQ